MTMTQKNQHLLNWLNSQKLKDQKELEYEKNKIIREIKGIDKQDLFPTPKKLSLWQKIKVLIMGQ
jgi:hypothetical protein